ncbi:Uncharacterised protein [Mycobacterium tuberculosis]|uniref:Uncharacterized protein n=1 Tax=Mycobacterium tuberculosis TaxID=1773 RepID=A0A916PBQ3_MYCTX|nr:Uncharacterised protein [Mycobacterium tuberculosis]COW38706.1 Uncharacterised protein [Mycobacterium tuberculosis]COW99966.1 Uncharacterised protein [Mycobacterium tuberculosis]COY34553.1 Uncharacterised protein [Mycobacterium tuberculosis]COY48839.1 Uncharacterised protein [Mycobacterium tuberculosis]
MLKQPAKAMRPQPVQSDQRSLDTAHVFGCHHNQTSDVVEDIAEQWPVDRCAAIKQYDVAVGFQDLHGGPIVLRAKLVCRSRIILGTKHFQPVFVHHRVHTHVRVALGVLR